MAQDEIPDYDIDLPADESLDVSLHNALRDDDIIHNETDKDVALLDIDTSFRAEVVSARRTLPIAITSPEEYTQAHSALAWFVGMRKKIKAKYAPFKRSAEAHLRLLRQSERGDLSKCQPGEDQCHTLINAWEAKQEAEAREGFDDALAVAGIEALAARKRQLDTISKELDLVTGPMKEALLSVRTSLKNKPLTISPPPVMDMYVRPPGHSVRVNYSAAVVDLMLLVQAVARGKAELDCLQPNRTHLNARARREKSLLSIPGVQPVKSDKKTVIRGGGRLTGEQ